MNAVLMLSQSSYLILRALEISGFDPFTNYVLRGSPVQGLKTKKKFNRFTPSRIDILTFLFLRSSCINIVPKPVNNVIFVFIFAYNNNNNNNNNNNKVQRFLYSKKEKNNTENLVS